MANDLLWANQRLIGVVIQRYVKAREAYCADENRPSIPTGATRLNRVVCSLVDDFRGARNTTHYTFTAARTKYVAKVRTFWRLTLKKDFYELVDYPPAIPDPDQDADWLGTGGPSDRPTPSSFGGTRAATGPNVTLLTLAAVSGQPADTDAAIPPGVLVGQSSEPESAGSQGRQETGREQERQIQAEEGNGQDHDSPVTPAGVSSSSIAASTSQQAHLHALSSSAVEETRAIEPVEETGPSQAVKEPESRQAIEETHPHPPAGLTKPVIDNLPGWLSRYTTACELYRAQLLGKPTGPERKTSQTPA